MFSRRILTLLRYSRRLWVRVVGIALLALLAALLAPLLSPLIPEDMHDRFDREAVLPVLAILASSMLVVTTFSLNVMVGAYRAASSQATPRSYRLLLEDTTTQTALATFTGAFIFSFTAIILFRAKIYDETASVTVFLFTVLVTILIILAILRWIDHLTQLGSMDHTLEIVEGRARTALENLGRQPHMGGRAATGVPESAVAVPAPMSGYVQIVDMPGLQGLAETQETRVHVAALPGAHVLRGQTLAWLEQADAETAETAETAAGHFTIAEIRSIEQDARYGLIVLGEIASRALSPGINDPGTAIDVIDRLGRLLWDMPGRDEDTDVNDRVFVPPVDAEELIASAFRPLTLDAAPRYEVALRLAHALEELGRAGPAPLRTAARDMLERTQAHAAEALVLEADRDRVAAVGR